MMGPFTPQSQFEADRWDERDASIVYRVDWLGEQRKDIARSLRISYTRVTKIYQRGQLKQRRGLI